MVGVPGVGLSFCSRSCPGAEDQKLWPRILVTTAWLGLAQDGVCQHNRRGTSLKLSTKVSLDL